MSRKISRRISRRVPRRRDLRFGAAPGGIQLPTYQAIGTAVAGTGAVAPEWPEHEEGDIAWLFVSTGGTEPAALSDAQGFVEVDDSPQDTADAIGAGACLTAFWCRATSDAMAAPTIADPGNHVHAVIMTTRGNVASGDPWDVTSGDVLGAGSTAVSIPGDTTTIPNCLVIAACAHSIDDVEGTPQAGSWANASLESVDERFDGSTNSGQGSGLVIATGAKVAAGAVSATTATLATSSRQARLMIATKGLGA